MSLRTLAAVVALSLFTPLVAFATTTVVVLGDSITAGYGLDASESYPSLVQQQLAGHDVRVINAGLSGDTTAGGLRRLDWLLKGKCDVLVVALGANDGLRGVPVTETASNLKAIISKTKGRFPNARIIVAGMLVPPNMGPDYSERYRAVFPDVANETGAKLLPFLLEGVAGIAALNQADGIHPTAAGQQKIAELLVPVLTETLNELKQQ